MPRPFDTLKPFRPSPATRTKDADQMVRTLLSTLFLAVLLVTLPSEQAAATDVLGQVKDSVTGAPLSGTVVKILQTGDSTQTDLTGHYKFLNVPKGTYTFLIGHSTYQPRIKPSVLVGSCCVGLAGNVDCDPGDAVDIGDLTALVDNLFITFTPLCCPAEANCDGDVGGNVDIGDLTALVDNLFITFTPLPACQ